MFDKYFIEGTNELNWEYIMTIPNFLKLKDCKQNPKWHSEGTAFQHTQCCLKAAYDLLEGGYSSLSFEDKRLLIVAVLFHDIGKSVTTEYIKDNWHSYNHEYEGEKIARAILWDEPFNERERICSLIRHHMEVLNIPKSKDVYQKMIQMSFNPFFSWKDLLFVKRCDVLGCQPMDPNQTTIDINKILFIENSVKKMGIYVCDNIAYDKNAAFNKPINFNPDSAPLNKPQLTLNVLIGLPGAGKNTFINKQFPNAITISRDDIRIELGYCNEDEKIVGTPEQENKVTEIFNNRLLSSVKDNSKPIVINNINLKRKYREDYKKLLQNYDIKWIYWYVEAPTLEDNFKRRNKIPSINIYNMIFNFDWPQADEYDEIKYIKEKKED